MTIVRRREVGIRSRFLILILKYYSLLASSSIVEGTKKGSASLDPMGRVLVSGDADLTDEVSRVTSGGQNTFPVHSEVERHQVYTLLVLVGSLQRDEVDHWSHCE